MRFASSQILGQFFLLGDIHPRAHESLERFAVNHGNAYASNGANLPIRAHDSLRKVEFAMIGQDVLNRLFHKLAIFWVYESQIFPDRWRHATRIKAMDLKQLRR